MISSSIKPNKSEKTRECKQMCRKLPESRPREHKHAGFIGWENLADSGTTLVQICQTDGRAAAVNHPRASRFRIGNSPPIYTIAVFLGCLIPLTWAYSWLSGHDTRRRQGSRRYKGTPGHKMMRMLVTTLVGIMRGKSERGRKWNDGDGGNVRATRLERESRRRIQETR